MRWRRFFALRAVQKMRAAPSWDVAHSFAVADWILSGLGIALSIYLRPDGGLLLLAIALYLFWLAISAREMEFVWVGVLLGVVSLLPLLPWTLRNWRTLQQIEPLAPFYAEMPGEYVPKGFNRWTKTWIVDFISVMNVYWNVSAEGPGEAVDISNIPARTYDNPAQKQRTEQLFAQYNEALTLSPEMDRAFAELADTRIRERPLRYYVALPLARLADMWLRPRTEMLNLQLDWWNWEDVPQESAISVALALLDVFYIVAALMSVRRKLPGCGMLWILIVCRSALLATLPNPEPRYTLECFPALLMLAGVGLARKTD
ncbi:MAG: hypothetical protein DMG64_06620 [Acidobacteria bacterium]|nr:MAG: hypothetical protein DMG64_06620 [Acidobacteriota bacterium]